MNSQVITYRPALKSESRDIARLYRMASEGVSDYIWQELAHEDEELLDIGQRRYEREDTDFSYQNCIVALANHQVVGMIMGYPMHIDPNLDFDKLDKIIRPYAKLEEDNSFYICGLAVFEAWQQKGIGSHLLQLAESKAIALNLSKMSLIVAEQNNFVLNLYKKLGYSEVAREKIVPHPLIHMTGNALLMVKHL